MSKNNEELKRQYHQRDRSVRVLSKDGHFRVVCVKSSQTSRKAQENHNLDKVPAFFLSRVLSSALMMSSFLKGEERVVVEADGSGPIKKVFAEALQLGETRGFVELNDEFSGKKINDISEILGAGTLRVSKVLYHKAEPIQGIVPLVKGDIADDLVYYFAQSEQIPAAVVLDTEFDNDGLIEHAGGMIIQAMPGYDKKQLQELFIMLNSLNSITEYFARGLNPLETLKEILPFEFDLVNSIQVDFYCRCSKESFMSKLLTLGPDEIKGMKEHSQNELVCKYCNKHYYLENEDFDKLLEETIAKTN